jgi:hypothetical protein
MSLALKVYTAFKDDEAKAKILAEALDEMLEEIRKNNQSKNEAATRDELQQANLNLQLGIKEVEKNLTVEIEKTHVEIEKVRAEIKEVEKNLMVEIEKTHVEIEKTRSDLMKHMNRQVIWIIGSVSVIIGALKALDYILK